MLSISNGTHVSRGPITYEGLHKTRTAEMLSKRHAPFSEALEPYNFTRMTEAKRKQNGSKTEANIFFGNRSALKAFLSQMRLSKEIFQRSAETSETCCNFTCITEAKRKENGSGAEAKKLRHLERQD